MYARSHLVYATSIAKSLRWQKHEQGCIVAEDPVVLVDKTWTGAEELVDVLKTNEDEDPELLRQYIATRSGVTRTYPGHLFPLPRVARLVWSQSQGPTGTCSTCGGR